MKLKCYPEKHPHPLIPDEWCIQAGDQIIRNLNKELAEEICRRWNLCEILNKVEF